MNREELSAHLTHIRELKLRDEVAQLKLRAARLEQIELRRAGAISAAAESAGYAAQLGDLGLLGEIRLDCARRASQMEQQVRVLSDQVTRSYKLTQTARQTHARIISDRLASEDGLRERDAEQFLTWQRGSRRGS